MAADAVVLDEQLLRSSHDSRCEAGRGRGGGISFNTGGADLDTFAKTGRSPSLRKKSVLQNKSLAEPGPSGKLAFCVVWWKSELTGPFEERESTSVFPAASSLPLMLLSLFLRHID